MRTRRTLAAAAVCCAAGGLLLPSSPALADTTPVSFRNAPLASWQVQGVGYATLVVGNVVYVGGSFTSVTSPDGTQSVNRSNLAAFNASTGALLTTFRADANNTVRALAYDGTTLYAGGAFTSVDGVSRSHLVAVDPASGTPRKWKANVRSNVYGLAVNNGNLFVVGSFTTMMGTTRNRVAAVNVATDTLTSFAPDVNGTVMSVAVSSDGGRIYIGGSYTTVNGTASTHLTALSSTGAVVPITWQKLSGPVLSMETAETDSRLAVAVGGSANQGAFYDTTTGQRYWYQRCDGNGQAVHVVNGSMFTGFHQGCNGDTTTRLVSNTITTGQRDTSFTPTFNNFWGVRGIAGSTALLVVVGDFTTISGVAVGGFAIFPPRT